MNIIKFEEKPEQMKENFIDKGSSGCAYKLDNNEVYKEFYYPMKDKEVLHRLSQIKNSAFALPKQIIEVNDEVAGYIMDYVDGVEINYIDENVSFDQFLLDIRKFELAVSELTREFVEIRDINFCNLLYTSDGFKALDTDYYRFYDTDDFSSMYKKNLDDFNATIMLYLINYRSIKELPSGIKRMYDYIILNKGMLLSQYIKESKTILEGYYNVTIKTMGDFLSITNPNREKKSYGYK